jgi:hypothetical protein
MTLLIHSMSEFSEIILGSLRLAGARTLVEIGAEFGGMSQLLGAHAAEAGGSLTSIDPAAKPEFEAWLAANPHVRHLARPSLEAIPELAQVDAWIVDGDHNYYTVYHELHAIDALCARDGRPLLAFLHDVSWPCARRDSYYAPERIPAEWRHPHCWDGGVTLGTDRLTAGEGFRGMGQFAWARHAGGPRNGVLTAVEDFIEEAGRGGERPIAFAHVPAVFGLAIVFDSTAPWAADLASALMPYHQSHLLARLEENRLANYLRVIEIQDAFNRA